MKLLWWIRRDLRLQDNPALAFAHANGASVQPVYIHAPDEEAPWRPGAASNWWLRESLEQLRDVLRQRQTDLLIISGSSQEILLSLLNQGFDGVLWNRLYEPAIVERDRRVGLSIVDAGKLAKAFPGHLLREPHQVRKGDGSAYRVFTPYWKSAQGVPHQGLEHYIPEDIHWHRSTELPATSHLAQTDDLNVIPELASHPWQATLKKHQQPGENAAQERMADIFNGLLDGYGERRDLPSVDGTSRLSAALHFGEISVARLWQQSEALTPADRARFRTELGWREFAHHLLWHFPQTTEQNFNPRFDSYPWRTPATDDPNLLAWQQGKTGITIVDAGMQQLWQSGWMHNRVRMLVGSLLTKNLNIHWHLGARWFWDTLVDADLASNTLGWQWVAGCGADAAPFFRIFNPDTQAEKYDAEARYRRQWIVQKPPSQPIVDLKSTRADALATYKKQSNG